MRDNNRKRKKRVDEVFCEYERMQKRQKRLDNIANIKQRESLKRKKYRESREYVKTEHVLRKKRKIGFSFPDSVINSEKRYVKVCHMCAAVVIKYGLSNQSEKFLS